MWVTVGACLLLRALCDDCPANRTCTLVGIHRAALAGLGLPNRYWPVGLMDRASASGAGDSRFESWAGQLYGRARGNIYILQNKVCGRWAMMTRRFWCTAWGALVDESMKSRSPSENNSNTQSTTSPTINKSPPPFPKQEKHTHKNRQQDNGTKHRHTRKTQHIPSTKKDKRKPNTHKQIKTITKQTRIHQSTDSWHSQSHELLRVSTRRRDRLRSSAESSKLQSVR